METRSGRNWVIVDPTWIIMVGPIDLIPSSLHSWDWFVHTYDVILCYIFFIKTDSYKIFSQTHITPSLLPSKSQCSNFKTKKNCLTLFYLYKLIMNFLDILFCFACRLLLFFCTFCLWGNIAIGMALLFMSLFVLSTLESTLVFIIVT